MNWLQGVAIWGCVAAVTVAVPALSKDANVIAIPADDDALILPANSPLHFRSFGPENAVEFDGAIELSGTWYYGDNQFNDTGTADPTFYFVPDKASFARLPRFKTRGQPGDIYLTNGNALLDAVATRAERAEAEKKGSKYLSGKIDIWVDRFEAGIECDAPFFNARFLRVAEPPLRVARAELPDVGC